MGQHKETACAFSTIVPLQLSTNGLKPTSGSMTNSTPWRNGRGARAHHVLDLEENAHGRGERDPLVAHQHRHLVVVHEYSHRSGLPSKGGTCGARHNLQTLQSVANERPTAGITPIFAKATEPTTADELIPRLEMEFTKINLFQGTEVLPIL